MSEKKRSPLGWHPDETDFLIKHNVVNAQHPLDAIVCVKERWIKNTLREVFLTPNGYVVKRYSHFPGRKDYRKVWVREHSALTKLSGRYTPESFGFVRAVHNSGAISILHLRTLLEGDQVQWNQPDDMAKLAQLLSGFHKQMVVTLDPQQENFIRLHQPSGELGFIDMGRARTFTGVSLLMLVNVGKELARLQTEGGLPQQQFKQFLKHYRKESNFTSTQQDIIKFSMTYWLNRHARKLRKQKSKR